MQNTAIVAAPVRAWKAGPSLSLYENKKLTLFGFCLFLVSGLAGAPADWHFGSAPGPDGDGGFQLSNTSATNGEWTVEAESLRFRNAYVSEDADGNNFTEAAAVVDLRDHGWEPGRDFTLFLEFDIEGVADWNRLGIIAFASDMSGHRYNGRGFYHGQLRVQSGGAYRLGISDGFSGDRPMVAIPMPGKIENGAYRLTLSGAYDDRGALTMRVEAKNEGSGEMWITKAPAIGAPPDDAWFGFGGRVKAYAGARQPVIDFKRFGFKPEATEPPGIEGDPIQYLGTWPQGGQDRPYRVSVRQAAHSYSPLPTVVYLRNLNVPRIGTDPDEAIVADLLDDGLVVIEVECGGLPKEFPALQDALMGFNDDIIQRISRLTRGAIVPDEHHLYWLPSGYRLARNIPFWNIERHGAPGSLEWIVRTFNSEVVERAGVDPIETPDQLHGPSGEQLDYNLYLDIMYPSGQPEERAPVIAHFSSLSQLPSGLKNERAIYPISWLTSGYALVYVDHIYNPLARARYYGHFGPYSLMSWNGLSAGAAAIRYLRAHADRYNLDSAIGALGHSKSSYSVVRLADPRHPEQEEYSQFSGFPREPKEPQPWRGYSSEIQVAYASMGSGTRRTELFNSHMVPIFTAAGHYDQYDEWRRFPALISVCEKEAVHHHGLWMEDLGHTFPIRTDLASGRNRTGMVKTFFDQHLHPRKKPDPLEVLAIIPADGNEDVDLNGMSRFIMVEDDKLPVDMHGLRAEKPVSVIFARRIDVSSVKTETLQLREADGGAPAPGEWIPSLQKSRFQFKPAGNLKPGTRYEIVVRPGIHDELGLTLDAPVIQGFRTSSM